MASRHTASRRRSYGRRVHELRERAHEDRRASREELRVSANETSEDEHDDTGWNEAWREARDAG
jgi:hypothetical protein